MRKFKHELIVQLAHHARRAQEMTEAVSQAEQLAERRTGERSLRVTLQAPRNRDVAFDKVKFFSDVADLLPAMQATMQFQMSLVDEYLETLEGSSLSDEQAKLVQNWRQAANGHEYGEIVHQLIANRLVSYREF